MQQTNNLLEQGGFFMTMKLPDRFTPTMQLARQISVLARERGVKIGTIESCTAGLVSATLASVPGGTMHMGFVTYNDRAKRAAGVTDEVLDHPDGPYSHAAAKAMAKAVLKKHENDNIIATATTGVLDREDKTRPHIRRGTFFVGIGSHDRETISHEIHIRLGRRRRMQKDVVRHALILTRNYLQSIPIKS